MNNNFTICVLLYGDFPKLAERCLSSIIQTLPDIGSNLRIGMNAVSRETLDVVRKIGTGLLSASAENIHKYPMMRHMLYGENRITTPYTMWFDDDSYLLKQSDGDIWLKAIEAQMEQADMLGSIYWIKWRGQQREFVKAQPWYGGKDPAASNSIRFATGGWWVIRTEILYQLNYPWPSLDHRGGDVMLGEACRQQDLRLVTYKNSSVCINADDRGRESKSPRRGFDQPPIGMTFEPDKADTLDVVTPLPTPPVHRKIVEL